MHVPVTLPCTTKQCACDWLAESWRKRYFRDACKSIGTNKNDFFRGCELFMSECPTKNKYYYHHLQEFFKSVGVLLPKRMPQEDTNTRRRRKSVRTLRGGLCNGKWLYPIMFQTKWKHIASVNCSTTSPKALRLNFAAKNANGISFILTIARPKPINPGGLLVVNRLPTIRLGISSLHPLLEAVIAAGVKFHLSPILQSSGGTYRRYILLLFLFESDSP